MFKKYSIFSEKFSEEIIWITLFANQIFSTIRCCLPLSMLLVSFMSNKIYQEYCSIEINKKKN